jgi:hypothetical protein
MREEKFGCTMLAVLKLQVVDRNRKRATIDRFIGTITTVLFDAPIFMNISGKSLAG